MLFRCRSVAASGGKAVVIRVTRIFLPAFAGDTARDSRIKHMNVHHPLKTSLFAPPGSAVAGAFAGGPLQAVIEPADGATATAPRLNGCGDRRGDGEGALARNCSLPAQPARVCAFRSC